MLLNVFFLYLHILPSISGTITIVPYKKNKKIIKKINVLLQHTIQRWQLEAWVLSISITLKSDVRLECLALG